MQARLPPIEVYFGAKQARKRPSQVFVAKSPDRVDHHLPKLMTPQPSGFRINLVKIDPDASSEDELNDFAETPRVKKLNLKGIKRDIEVIPKILIDRSSYNMMLQRQNTESARAESTLVTPRQVFTIDSSRTVNSNKKLIAVSPSKHMLEVNSQDHQFNPIDRKVFSHVRPMFLATRVPSQSSSP